MAIVSFFLGVGVGEEFCHAPLAGCSSGFQIDPSLPLRDKMITYLIFIPNDCFKVIPCVLCVQKRTSRGTDTELLDEHDLTEICFERIR